MEKFSDDFRGIPDNYTLMHKMNTRLGPVLYKLNRLRARLTPFVSVNEYGKGAPHVSLSFLAHPANAKSDGFILTAPTEKTLEVWVSDGGFAAGETLSELMNLRRQLLEKANLSGEEKNPRYKLEVCYLVSHFHIDHINEGILNILPSPYIRVKRVYFPHISVYARDLNHDFSRNGDIGHRSRFMLAQKAYQPLAELVQMPFGHSCTVPLGEGKITLMMPDIDWGTPENTAKLIKYYNAKVPEKIGFNIPVQVVNSNCLIARIEYASRSMLLTGDAMKKNLELDDEPFDMIVRQYGEALRSDIVKYPHHGKARNGAWRSVRDNLMIPSPDAVTVLTGPEAADHAVPYLNENNVPWVIIDDATLTFTITPDGQFCREQGPVRLR